MPRKRRQLCVDWAASITIIWPRAADASSSHCPRTHHALGMVYIPPRGGWTYVTFGEKPLKNYADSEHAAITAVRRAWGLY